MVRRVDLGYLTECASRAYLFFSGKKSGIPEFWIENSRKNRMLKAIITFFRNSETEKKRYGHVVLAKLAQ